MRSKKNPKPAYCREVVSRPVQKEGAQAEPAGHRELRGAEHQRRALQRERERERESERKRERERARARTSLNPGDVPSLPLH